MDKIRIKAEKSWVRFLTEMKNVLYDQDWAKRAENFGIYYVYRGVKQKNELRYDITIMPSRMLGKEFPKTKGHKHLKNFQELITVLEGKAFYLFQKSKNKKIEDVYVIEAKKGDVIIAPPGYDHCTINPSKKELKMANWISKKCQSDYTLFEKMQGACYFAIAQKLKMKFEERCSSHASAKASANEKLKIKWVKNTNYKKIPKLRFEKPLNPIRKNKILKAIEALGFSNGVKKIPKNLDFLAGVMKFG